MALTGSRRREVYRVYSHEAFLADGSVAEPLERAAAREHGPLRLLVGVALPIGLVVAATVSLALESARHSSSLAQMCPTRALPARKRVGALVEHQRRSRKARSIRTTSRVVAQSRRGDSRPSRHAHRRLATATRAASLAAPVSRSTSHPAPPPASESQGPEFLFER